MCAWRRVRLTDLTPGGVIVDRMTARDKDLEIGDPVTVTFPGGITLDLTIDAISDDQTMLGVWTLEHRRSTAARGRVVRRAHRHRLVGRRRSG